MVRAAGRGQAYSMNRMDRDVGDMAFSLTIIVTPSLSSCQWWSDALGSSLPYFSHFDAVLHSQA